MGAFSDNKPTRSPTTNLGRFDSVEERDSWYRWVSHGLDLFRKAMRCDDEQRRRIEFKHRPNGPAPLDSTSIESRIAKAIAVRDRLIVALWFQTTDNLDVIYAKLAEKRPNVVCIAMAEAGVLNHWEPKQGTFAGKKHHPRRTLSQADHDQRMREADKLIEGVL